MSGCYGGLQALVRRKVLDALLIQRIIHREGLTKATEFSTEPIPGNCVESVIYIKTLPQKTKSCTEMVEYMGSDQSSLLFNEGHPLV